MSRWGVKCRIAEVLKADPGLAELTVETSWSGDLAPDSMLILGEITGALEVTTLGRAPRKNTDSFSISCVLGITGFLTADEACVAAETTFATVREVVNRLHRLTDASGAIPDGDTDAYTGIRSVQITTYDGPNPVYPQPNSSSPVAGVVAFDLACTADYFA